MLVCAVRQEAHDVRNNLSELENPASYKLRTREGSNQGYLCYILHAPHSRWRQSNCHMHMPACCACCTSSTTFIARFCTTDAYNPTSSLTLHYLSLGTASLLVDKVTSKNPPIPTVNTPARMHSFVPILRYGVAKHAADVAALCQIFHCAKPDACKKDDRKHR